MNQELNNERESEMLEEYDFSGGVRGKYAARFTRGSHVVVLDPDVVEVFPDAEVVNEALRFLIRVTKENQPISNAKDDA